MDAGNWMVLVAVILAVAGVLHSFNSRVPAPAVSKLAELDQKWKAEKAELEKKKNLEMALKETQKDLETSTPMSPKQPEPRDKTDREVFSEAQRQTADEIGKLSGLVNTLAYRVSSLEKRQPQAVHMLPPTAPIEVIVVTRPKPAKAKPKPLLERAGIPKKRRDR